MTDSEKRQLMLESLRFALQFHQPDVQTFIKDAELIYQSLLNK